MELVSLYVPRKNDFEYCFIALIRVVGGYTPYKQRKARGTQVVNVVHALFFYINAYIYIFFFS